MRITQLRDEVKSLVTVLEGKIFLLGKEWNDLPEIEKKELVKTVSYLNDMVRGQTRADRSGLAVLDESYLRSTQPYGSRIPEDVLGRAVRGPTPPSNPVCGRAPLRSPRLL